MKFIQTSWMTNWSIFPVHHLVDGVLVLAGLRPPGLASTSLQSPMCRRVTRGAASCQALPSFSPLRLGPRVGESRAHHGGGGHDAGLQVVGHLTSISDIVLQTERNNRSLLTLNLQQQHTDLILTPLASHPTLCVVLGVFPLIEELIRLFSPSSVSLC